MELPNWLVVLPAKMTGLDQFLVWGFVIGCFSIAARSIWRSHGMWEFRREWKRQNMGEVIGVPQMLLILFAVIAIGAFVIGWIVMLDSWDGTIPVRVVP